MPLKKLKGSEARSLLGVRTKPIIEESEIDPRAPGVSLATLEPGAAGERNGHSYGELFYIISGEAVVIEESGQQEKLCSGDAVYFAPLVERQILNQSDIQELHFIRIWWGADCPPPQIPGDVERPLVTLVTATPPTPNGDLHLGHISGPYLAGDVIRRYLRMRGEEVHYITGIDDNQSYVALKALQNGQSPSACAKHFGDQIILAWDSCQVEPNFVGRPDRSARHRRLAEDFFDAMYRNGKLRVQSSEALYCKSCSRSVFEAFVNGICPHCGKMSNGNACEICCRPNDCIDLGDPKCTACGEKTERFRYERFYFPLSDYTSKLQEYLTTVEMSPRLRLLCETMIRDGLPDIAVSHLSDYGIPVPVPGYEKQTIYVWFEMASGYLAATQDYFESKGDWRKFWVEDACCPSTVVQCFGMDNAYFHTLLFPALYFAYDSSLRPPKCFVTNEFLLLDGEKFSTSRGHVVLAQEFAKSHNTDQIRFYLAMVSPETEQTNFNLDGFTRTVTTILVGTWVAWLSRIYDNVERFFGGVTPSPGLWSNRQLNFYQTLGMRLTELRCAYEPKTFTLRGAATALCRLVEDADMFRSAHATLDAQGEYARTTVALQLCAVRALALGASPLMPDFAQQLWANLGYETEVATTAWSDVPVLVPPMQRIVVLSDKLFEDR